MSNKITITGFSLNTVAGTDLEPTLGRLKSGSTLTSSFDKNWNRIDGISYNTSCELYNNIKRCVSIALNNAGIIDMDKYKVSIVCGSNFYETNIWETNNIDASLLWGLNYAVNRLVKELKVNAAVINVSTACSSGASAIVTACQLIDFGESDIVIVIGYDFRTLIPEMGMRVIGALSKVSIAPFSLNRTGTDLADGLGVIILERPDTAKSRNAEMIAYVIGYGVASDAYSITAPDPEGVALENAIRRAIDKAEIEPSEIQYINAHGSGTPSNDALETRVIKKVFGEHAKNLFINSSKSIIGHTLGAAGIVEAIITVLALENAWIHPTANYVEVDPECDLNYCTKGCVYGDFKYAMSNSIGFGGTNVSIVFEKGGLNEE